MQCVMLWNWQFYSYYIGKSDRPISTAIGLHVDKDNNYIEKAYVRDEYIELIRQTPFGQLVNEVRLFLRTSLLDELVEFWSMNEQGLYYTTLLFHSQG